MKAKELIWFPNLRAFSHGSWNNKDDTSFKVLPNEDVEQKLVEHGYSSEEVNEAKVRILRGNPHWISLETKEEQKQKVKVDNDKEKEQSRKEQLFRLNKKEQTAMLREYGIDHVPVSEIDRVNLIYDIESKQGN